MRLQLISDLHTEFYPDPQKFIERIEIVPDLDFLVIAGDLVVPSKQSESVVKAVFEHFSKKARHVIYVEGNHEFYGGTLSTVEQKLRAVLPDNFHWLVNDERTIEGVHFYGGTMWFNNADQMNFFYRRYMNDFWQIADLESWVYGRNQGFTMLGQALIKPETIVVSHHMPHLKSTPAEFVRDSLNRFFVSDQTDLIEKTQPRLWFHGHTHQPCDYMLGNTHVLCNPHGYPNERRGKPYSQVMLDV